MQVIEKQTEKTAFNSNGYTAFCFDNFGVSELDAKLKTQPAANELIKWDLTPQQWRADILLAIKAIKND